MKKDSFIKNLSIVYFFMLVGAPIGYLIRIFYARSLSLNDYGLFYSIIALFGLIGILNDIGMNSALIHYLPKFIKEKNYKKITSSILHIFCTHWYE